MNVMLSISKIRIWRVVGLAFAVTVAVVMLIVASGALGTQVPGPAAATGGNSITVPDPGANGNVGFSTSIALDAAGFPVISHVSLDSGHLRIVHCNDVSCAGGNESISSVDLASAFSGTSLVLDASGFPVVSYEDPINNDLTIMHCNDVSCAGEDESITSPDTAGFIGEDSSLALDASGFPVVSYFGGFQFGSNDNLKILHCNDPNCSGNDESITSPDTAGVVGFDTSLALDASGSPVISYRDVDNSDLKIMHCNDANCSGDDESVSAPDSAGFNGGYSSLELDISGRPVVSYPDESSSNLKVLHCNDVNCVGGGESITTPDTSGSGAQYTSLELDVSGFPVVSYLGGASGALNILHCNDVNCAGGNDGITSPDPSADVGWDTSLALSASGFPVVSHRDAFNGDLKVARCNDAACAAGGDTNTSPDIGAGLGDVGRYASLALDASGLPVVAYYDANAADLKLLHCNDINCAGGNESITSAASTGSVGEHTSLALDGSGFPVIAYSDNSNNQLALVHCNDPNCAGNNESVNTPDITGTGGQHTSLALDAAGFPVITYYDDTAGGMKVVHCNDVNCAGTNESVTVPDTSGSTSENTSLELDASGFPVVSYHDSSNGDLKVLHCNDANCAGNNESITIPDPKPDTEGAYTSLELDASGFPVVSYFYSLGDLRVLHCNDANCAGGGESVTTPDSGDVGRFTSLALDASGWPVVSYQDEGGSGINVMHCNDANCAGGDESIASPDVGFNSEGTSLALDASGRPVVAYRDNDKADLKLLHCNDANCSGDKPVPTPTKQPDPGDTDQDGCSDVDENQQDIGSEVFGGLRNYLNFWDFYDVPAGAGLTRDGAVSGNDIFAVIGRFNSTDAGAGTFDRFSDPLSTPNALVIGAFRENYHPAYDRGGILGPDIWDLAAANGSIAGTDIFNVIGQFGHACG